MDYSSYLVRHPARKRSGSILTIPEPARGINIMNIINTINVTSKKNNNRPVFNTDKLLATPSEVRRYFCDRDNRRSSLYHSASWSPVAEFRLHWSLSVDCTRIVITLGTVGVPASFSADSSGAQQTIRIC